MHPQKLSWLSLIFILLIAVLHSLALIHYLYWLYPWFDILMHFLGGFWVAITSLWLLSEYASTQVPYVSVWKLGIGVVLLVGIGWELFEFVINSPREHAYVLDTTLDIIMDTIGGVFGVVIARKL